MTEPEKGWFEEYSCGCVSEIVTRKRDLLGYCGKHGNDRRHVHRSHPNLTKWGEEERAAGEPKREDQTEGDQRR